MKKFMQKYLSNAPWIVNRVAAHTRAVCLPAAIAQNVLRMVRVPDHRRIARVRRQLCFEIRNDPPTRIMPLFFARGKLEKRDSPTREQDRFRL